MLQLLHLHPLAPMQMVARERLPGWQPAAVLGSAVIAGWSGALAAVPLHFPTPLPPPPCSVQPSPLGGWLVLNMATRQQPAAVDAIRRPDAGAAKAAAASSVHRACKQAPGRAREDPVVVHNLNDRALSLTISSESRAPTVVGFAEEF